MATIPGFGNVEIGPNLRPLLVTNEITTRNAMFASKSAEAAEEQASLIRLLSWTNVVILLVAVLSGIVLAVSVYKAGWPFPEVISPDTLVTWLAGAISLLTILATTLGQLARNGDKLGRWQTLRAEAEMMRSGRFAAIARSAAAAGQAAAREALELVRLGLLDDQRRWYAARAGRHRNNAKVTNGFSVFALLLTAIASAAALSVSFSAVTAAALLVGVLAAAFSAFSNDRENLFRDKANADLYERTAEKLSLLMAGSDSVQAEIEASNPQAVVVFTDLVVEELQAEHKQWAASLDRTGELLTRLEQRLQQARTADTKRAQALEAAVAARASVNDVGQKAITALAAVGPTGHVPVTLPTTVTVAVPFSSPVPITAPVADATSIANRVAALTNWQPLLAAGAAVLPPPHGARSQAVLSGLTTTLGTLDSAAPTSSAITAAEALVDSLRPDNPLGQWFALVAPQLAGVLGTALPPLGLALGLAAIGAKLGEDAYRRWVATVLNAPFSPGLIEPAAITSTMVLAALEVSPIFAAAWGPERAASNLAAMTSLGETLVQDPEQLWAQEQTRFGADRAQFDKGVQEMRTALIGAHVADDVAAIGSTLPGSVDPGTVLRAAQGLSNNAQTGPALQTMVQLVHELREAGVTDPAGQLGMAFGAPTS